MNIYALGVPYTIIVDDYLPFKQDGSHLFANIGYDQALWGPLAEKAIAKYVGNYWHTDVGQNFDAVAFLNGGPSYYLEHWRPNQQNPDEFWHTIKRENKNRNIITSKSNARPDHDIRSNHAYVILDQIESGG